MRKHLAALAAATALLACFTPTQAEGHAGNPNFSSQVHGLSRPVEGISVEVLGFDDRLQLLNRSGKTVVIYGYEGEPYSRILADGTVETNANSPAVYLNEDRYAAVQVPKQADASAPADWTKVSDGGEFNWHDHRMHWMQSTTPPQVKNESRKTKIFDYRIPIRVGGRRDAIDGTLFWVGPADTPKMPLLIGGFVLIVICGAGVLVIRRRR